MEYKEYNHIKEGIFFLIIFLVMAFSTILRFYNKIGVESIALIFGTILGLNIAILIIYWYKKMTNEEEKWI